MREKIRMSDSIPRNDERFRRLRHLSTWELFDSFSLPGMVIFHSRIPPGSPRPSQLKRDLHGGPFQAPVQAVESRVLVMIQQDGVRRAVDLFVSAPPTPINSRPWKRCSNMPWRRW